MDYGLKCSNDGIALICHGKGAELEGKVLNLL